MRQAGSRYARNELPCPSVAPLAAESRPGYTKQWTIGRFTAYNSQVTVSTDVARYPVGPPNQRRPQLPARSKDHGLDR